jgi:hypothetical protein
MGFEDNDMEEQWARWDAKAEKAKKEKQARAVKAAAGTPVERLVQRRQDLLNAEFMGETTHEALIEMQGVIFDAEGRIEEGQKDLRLLDPNCDIRAELDPSPKMVVFSHAVQDAKRYIALSDLVQGDKLSGRATYPRKKSGKIELSQIALEYIGARERLRRADQGRLVERIDRAVLVRREMAPKSK